VKLLARKLVVEATLSDLKPLVIPLPLNPIDKTILIRKTTGPPTLEVAFKGFRFSSPGMRGAAALFDQRI
jgi:hypothetical protein